MPTRISQRGETRLIERFAKDRRLKTAKTNCGDFMEITIPGRQGQIYELDEDTLAVMFMPPATQADPCGKWTPKTWGNFKRTAAALGMTVLQNGDTEGCIGFNPRNKEQVKLAIQIGKVRAKRRVSAAQTAAFVERMKNPRVEGSVVA